MLAAMEQLRGKSSVLMIVVVVLAGGIWYLLDGGPSGSDDDGASSVRKPHDAFEMTVSSVQQDGSFRGKVETSGRYARDGLERLGTDERVTLYLADVAAQEPVRDPCWVEEGQDAIKELVGARIWVDADSVERERDGVFGVHAWNRDDVLVQEQLLRDGDGRVLGGRLSPRYGDVLVAAEEDAAAAERGLWGACGTS